MWFEIAVVATMFAVGNVVFGHFEEGTPKWRRLAKMALVMAIGVSLSTYLGRTWFWAFLGGHGPSRRLHPHVVAAPARHRRLDR